MLTILKDLNFTSDENIIDYYPCVRDRDDISVKYCRKTGVKFLSKLNHVTQAHYEEKQTDPNAGKNYSLNDYGNKIHNIPLLDDAQRRADEFGDLVTNKKWLDFGTGTGLILDLLNDAAATTQAVELNKNQREHLISKGYVVYRDISEVPDNKFEVITLFHVFEHLPDPIETLKALRKKLTKKGTLIIEVPHAKDFMLETLDLDAFKKFTFWSEHLILHTKESLKLFVEHVGFSDVKIDGFQRYPLSNHMYWLKYGKPGGHKAWDFMNNDTLNIEYVNMLKQLDQTDTIVAYVKNT